MSVSRDNDRGFQWAKAIEGTYNDTVRVSESSMDGNPGFIWVWVECPSNLGVLDGPRNKAQVHLPLAAAKILRDDLTQVIENHFLGEYNKGKEELQRNE